MKIGFDAKRAFNNNTGLGNYSRFIIDALLKYNAENTYFAYTPKVSTAPFTEKYLTTPSLNFTIRMPTFKKMKSFWRSFLITTDLKKDGIEVFHGLSNELPIGLKRNNIKAIVTIHDLIFERYPNLYPAFDRFIYKLKFKKACQYADLVIAVSEQTKRDIIEYYQINPEKIAVVYQDSDNVFKEKLSEEDIEAGKAKYNIYKKYLLCVATITERKNQLLLLKAFHKLHLSDYELILVGGKSAYQQQLEDYISEHSLTNVKIFNKVPFADLPALYQGASLFVYPSVFEGFGIPILEALHSGIPVIGATGSCLEEAGGKGALYANPEDVNDLSSKILQVLSNKTMQKQMVLDGQQHIAQFSAENIALQLQSLYQRVLS
ncbi:glycosyltransferase family 1 protein [Arcicella aquatica]|uniref:Glycosyltransferase family 1 protein n=1 Tax=Arcicella aquatica TaxID=217141 RepID=A0ABU5QKX5_9BACT|nr:glycosyltransferase family 1 protein [Arcicella aquatica]MEA5257716.1 glycosyltransferase family 1 protein [Arcicella aquatica]